MANREYRDYSYRPDRVRRRDPLKWCRDFDIIMIDINDGFAFLAILKDALACVHRIEEHTFTALTNMPLKINFGDGMTEILEGLLI